MAQLTLSSSEVQQLQDVARTLVTPLAHATLDDWRRAANREVKACLGADMASFLLPSEEGEPVVNEDVDLDHLRTYLDYVAELEPEWALLDRSTELSVFDRRGLLGERLAQYRRSRYYNEFIVPIRAFDMLGAAVPHPSLEVPASLYLHHTNPEGRRFGERGRALLQLLYPSLAAGVDGALRFHQLRSSLLRTLDDLRLPTFAFDRTGRCLHRNDALRSLLDCEPEEDLLVGEARRLGRSARNGSKMGTDRDAPVPVVRRRVRTRKGDYLLTVTHLDAATAPEWIRLVFVTRVGEGVGIDPERLVEEFGLTSREADVAILLARRLTNAEIAERLVISPHTARHHTERVLRKLGVRSRRDVPARVAEV